MPILIMFASVPPQTSFHGRVAIDTGVFSSLLVACTFQIAGLLILANTESVSLAQ